VAAASFGPEPPLGRRFEAWRRAGFQLHVGKPVDSTELLAVVETLTGRRVERRRRLLLRADWPYGVRCERRAS